MMITWMDSRQADGKWWWLSDYSAPEPVTAHSVGWMVQDDADAKVLAQSRAPDGDDAQVAGLKVIPTRSVVKIEHLVNANDDAGNVMVETVGRPSEREAAE